MGDDEEKDTVVADTQETGDTAEPADAVPAPVQEPVDVAAAPEADQPTATATTTSAKPEADSPESSELTTPVKVDATDKKAPAADENTAATDDDPDDPAKAPAGETAGKLVAIVASSKKSRPPYKYDPNKISLRFIFANRDGLTVTVECNPSDTVGEVKGALLSVWPEGALS